MDNTVNLGELPAGLWRDGVRKEKAHFDLNIARGAKENKKRFYRHLNQKRKVQFCILPGEWQRKAGNKRQREVWGTQQYFFLSFLW